MIINTKPRYSSQELSEKITEHIKELAEATDAARISGEMTRYLDCCAKFHRYSYQNVWLILMACSYATKVSGFKRWQSIGCDFRYVFDVSQNNHDYLHINF